MTKENNNTDVENIDSGEVHVSEFERLYKESIKTFNNGEIVTGKIVAITSKEIVVDIGYKSEGAFWFSAYLNYSEGRHYLGTTYSAGGNATYVWVLGGWIHVWKELPRY